MHAMVRKKPLPVLADTKLEKPSAPVRLSKAERGLLEEALRRGEDMRERAEAAVMEYGRWLLGEVFQNDARAAMDRKSKNPVWRELLRRAGGPTLSISSRMLYVAVALAAYDKSLPDRSWRGLDAGRKEALLPLGEPATIRNAARHVSELNLTRADTSAYVTELLRERGVDRGVRVTAPRVIARMRGLRDFLEKPAVIKRMDSLAGRLDPSERKAMAEEAERIQRALASWVRALRKRV